MYVNGESRSVANPNAGMVRLIKPAPAFTNNNTVILNNVAAWCIPEQPRAQCNNKNILQKMNPKQMPNYATLHRTQL